MDDVGRKLLILQLETRVTGKYSPQRAMGMQLPGKIESVKFSNGREHYLHATSFVIRALM
jgi:hypothetical protein